VEKLRNLYRILIISYSDRTAIGFYNTDRKLESSIAGKSSHKCHVLRCFCDYEIKNKSHTLRCAGFVYAVCMYAGGTGGEAWHTSKPSWRYSSGSVYDFATTNRGTLRFGELCEKVDVLWIDDGPTYYHAFAMDYMRGLFLKPATQISGRRSIEIFATVSTSTYRSWMTCQVTNRL